VAPAVTIAMAGSKRRRRSWRRVAAHAPVVDNTQAPGLQDAAIHGRIRHLALALLSSIEAW
jgi:hypothetical protein